MNIPKIINFRALCAILGIDYNRAYHNRLEQYEEKALRNVIERINTVLEDLIGWENYFGKIQIGQ